MLRFLPAVACVLIVGVIAPAATSAGTVFQNPDFQYVVDIPVGWEILDARESNFISFTDPDHVAVFQIIAFPGERFAIADDLDRFIRERFGAKGERSSFLYGGDFAVFADYTFTTTNSAGGGIPVRGYMTFINGDDYDFAVMTFAVVDHYERLHDTLLSALDSFSPDARHRMRPGPVSAFYAAPVKEKLSADDAGIAHNEQPNTLVLPSGTEFSLPPRVHSEGLREAAQVLIEREARLLAAYAPRAGESSRIGAGVVPDWARAWRRYFRMVYRDSVDRLESVAEAVFDDLAHAGVPREEMPARILYWLQEARYERTGSLSDLMSPAACLVEFAGDCDSLGITYAIILQHLGFDAILMVSMEFAHALVGVDVPGDGARFPFEGREWLVAELTAQVPIGRIAEEMSDIGGWVGIKLDPTIPW